MSLLDQTAVGSDVPCFIEALVAARPEIKWLKLFRPGHFPPLQDVAGLSPSEHDIIESGLRLRAETGLSFWDSTLLYLSTNVVHSQNVLKHATRHNPQNSNHSIINRAECTDDTFRRLIAGLGKGQILAISSAVGTDNGNQKHIPMLDFHCKETSTNLAVVRTVIRELGLNGFIAASGGSYHFYGLNLVDTDELISILGKSLLFSPIVDHRWVAHQLIERACGLRISPGKSYQFCPRVIDSVL